MESGTPEAGELHKYVDADAFSFPFGQSRDGAN